MTSQSPYLMCPKCKKTQATLSVHLRRVCMKKFTPEAITEVVEKAKANSRKILQSGIVFSYGDLAKIMMDASPIDRFVEELERRHMVVTDVPPLLLNTETSSITATQAQYVPVSEVDSVRGTFQK